MKDHKPSCFGDFAIEVYVTRRCGTCKLMRECMLATMGYSPEVIYQPHTEATTPLSTQVGGGHYKDMPIQPVEFIHKNGIGFCEGAAIKYLSRWRSKGGIEDLKKARHFIDLLIELESEQADQA